MSAVETMLDPKRLATVKARAALWGATLHALEGDDGRPLLVITRWSLTRSFTDLAEVERFLDRAGAKACGALGTQVGA